MAGIAPAIAHNVGIFADLANVRLHFGMAITFLFTHGQWAFGSMLAPVAITCLTAEKVGNNLFAVGIGAVALLTFADGNVWPFLAGMPSFPFVTGKAPLLCVEGALMAIFAKRPLVDDPRPSVFPEFSPVSITGRATALDELTAGLSALGIVAMGLGWWFSEWSGSTSRILIVVTGLA